MGGDLILPIIYLVCGGAVYFLPTIIAYGNKHRNALAIFLLNLLLGWTGLGWIGALIWSVMR